MTNLGNLNVLSFGNTIQIAGAILQGEGRTFLCYFPGDKNDLPLEVLELDLAEWHILVRQTDLLETEVLASASDGSLAKIVLRKSQRQIDANVQWKVFQRDNYSCRYCGVTGVPLTVDHLVLWEEGGPTVEANLVAACKKCNKIRGNTEYTEWLRHPRYLNLSGKLAPEVRAANEALIGTLGGIQRNVHKRTR